MSIRAWWNRTKCKLFGHLRGKPKVEVVDSELSEPGEKPRPVKMRIGTASCSRCGQLVFMMPGGIVYDSKYDKE
jgi:hypothetical protein